MFGDNRDATFYKLTQKRYESLADEYQHETIELHTQHHKFTNKSVLWGRYEMAISEMEMKHKEDFKFVGDADKDILLKKHKAQKSKEKNTRSWKAKTYAHYSEQKALKEKHTTEKNALN